MTPRELEEYRALRDTIRERGTARHWVAIVGLGIWAALALAGSVIALPALTLVPLLVLVASFEVVFTLHTGVERVGRYLQVFHEDAAEHAAWEHVAMAYGRAFGGGGIDALFSPVFAVATLLNFVPVALSGSVAVDWTIVGAVHMLFIVRIWSARRQAAGQRTLDLERFTTLKRERTTAA
ncbi:MAG: hypothetical protein ABL982_19595 [Vicinamibacterales bacterium]